VQIGESDGCIKYPFVLLQLIRWGEGGGPGGGLRVTKESNFLSFNPHLGFEPQASVLEFLK
jgi:hypothetical protein